MMWTLSIISLIGNLLNSLKIRFCFLLWIICNIGWFVIDVSAGVYSRAMLDIIQIGFSIFGFYKWGEYGQATGQVCKRTGEASCSL